MLYFPLSENGKYFKLENSLRVFLCIMLPTALDLRPLLTLDIVQFAPHFRVVEGSSINCVTSSTSGGIIRRGGGRKKKRVRDFIIVLLLIYVLLITFFLINYNNK